MAKQVDRRRQTCAVLGLTKPSIYEGVAGRNPLGPGTSVPQTGRMYICNPAPACSGSDHLANGTRPSIRPQPIPRSRLTQDHPSKPGGVHIRPCENAKVLGFRVSLYPSRVVAKPIRRDLKGRFSTTPRSACVFTQPAGCRQTRVVGDPGCCPQQLASPSIMAPRLLFIPLLRARYVGLSLAQPLLA